MVLLPKKSLIGWNPHDLAALPYDDGAAGALALEEGVA
jgi:hypothetical protein